MMKRVAAAIFLLAFAFSTVGRTIVRTQVWVAQHAFSSEHLESSRTGRPVTEAHKQNPQEKQTKLIEDGSVLHVSFISSSNTPPSADALAHALTGFIADPNHRALSSRAPPTLLS